MANKKKSPESTDKTSEKNTSKDVKKKAQKPPKGENPSIKEQKTAAKLPTKKDNKEAKPSSLKSQESVKLEPVKKGDKEKALKLFQDEKSETQETDSGLEKADLSLIGQNATLRGRYKKGQGEEENDALKRNIILAAQSLLSLAGTSIDELNGDGREKKKGGFGNSHKQKLLSAGSKEYMEDDLAVVTHGDVAQFEATKLVNDKNAEEKSSFISNEKTVEDLDDPFDTATATSTPSGSTIQAANPLNSQTYIPTRETSSPGKKGFFHYFGITAICLVALGSITYGIIFIANLFNNNSKAPTYAELQREAEEKEGKLETKTVVKVPLQNDDPLISEAKSVAKNFLTSENKRFAYSFIIQNKGVSKTFNKYWEQAPSFDESLLNYKAAYTLPGGAKWVNLSYGEGVNQRTMVLMKTDDNPFRLDWQSYSEIENMSLGDVVKEFKTEPYLIRTWVSPQHFYNAAYPDQHWQNYLAHDLQGNTLNCYVPLSTKAAQSIYQAIVNTPMPYPQAEKGVSGTYVKLMVRKPTIGAEFVEVIEVLDTTWFAELMD